MFPNNQSVFSVPDAPNTSTLVALLAHVASALARKPHGTWPSVTVSWPRSYKGRNSIARAQAAIKPDSDECVASDQVAPICNACAASGYTVGAHIAVHRHHRNTARVADVCCSQTRIAITPIAESETHAEKLG
jgi:hypothetical protein